MSTLSAKELVQQIAERTEIPRQDVNAVLTAMGELTLESLRDGQTVRLIGLGRVGSKMLKPRMFIHPTTRQPGVSPAKRVAHITLSREAHASIQPIPTGEES